LALLLLHVSKLTLPPSHEAALAASPKEGEQACITAFGAGPLAFRVDIIDVMRTVVDIDEVLLDRAAAQLGTKTKVDTVRAALAYVAEIPDRDRAIMESRYAFGTPDLADPEIMAGARR
jgi:Arc/MetJ family transcription regulator